MDNTKHPLWEDYCKWVSHAVISQWLGGIKSEWLFQSFCAGAIVGANQAIARMVKEHQQKIKGE